SSSSLVQDPSYPRGLPLTDILERYRQTLQSFTIGVKNLDGCTSSIKFPLWSDFPKLEELVIDRRWVINIHPLPSGHPLQKLEAHVDSLSAIPSLIKGGNMKEIILKRTRRTSDGEPPEKNEGLATDKIEVERLLEQSKDRGITFEITLGLGVLRPKLINITKG
ncbi:4975_t:CDS:2, partial [Acaulospora colombiana]